jgi:hypothetical protein
VECGVELHSVCTGRKTYLDTLLPWRRERVRSPKLTMFNEIRVLVCVRDVEVITMRFA